MGCLYVYKDGLKKANLEYRSVVGKVNCSIEHIEDGLLLIRIVWLCLFV